MDKANQLIELSAKDPQWEESMWIAGLRDECKKFATGARTDSIEILYRAL